MDTLLGFQKVTIVVLDGQICLIEIKEDSKNDIKAEMRIVDIIVRE
jgi:hypothetical protein